MKWILLALGGVLGVFGIVILAGLLTPVSHTAAVAALYPVEPAAVWQAVTDLDELAAWRPDVDRVERLPDADGMPRWREHNAYGSLTYQAEVLDPPHRLTARIEEEDLPFGGSWTWLLEPAAGGTRLTIVEEGEIHNPIFRALSRFVFGYHGTLASYHDLLAAHLGQEVRTEEVEAPALR